MAISTTQLNALRTIADGHVYVSNKGQTTVKGLTAPTFAALRKAGLATVDGSSRVTLPSGKAARKAVLTAKGSEVVSNTKRP